MKHFILLLLLTPMMWSCKSNAAQGLEDAPSTSDSSITSSDLAIATADLPAGTVGAHYDAVLAATGGVAPYAWTLTSGALSTGLTLSTDGSITGTPQIAGSSALTIEVTDAAAATASAQLSLSIVSAAITITTVSPLPDAVVGTAYDTGFSATGGVVPYTWAITAGALPDGLTFDTAMGVISGTPTTAGTSSLTIQATDAATATAAKAFDLVVAPAGALIVPSNFRVDVSVGTTGGLYVSWDQVSAASYYNLQSSLTADSGYTPVANCSGPTHGRDATKSGLKICRDGGRTPGTTYYYEVQACDSTGTCSAFSSPAWNIPVTSDCTAAQIPPVGDLKTPADYTIESDTVDNDITFQRTALQHAGFPATGVTRRHQLFVDLPGSGELCGIGFLAQTAQFMGYDVMCVNYSNAASQESICAGDPACFEAISQSKLDATGPCSVPNGAHCGTDPKTGQPYVNSVSADAVTQRISKMLQYLNANENINGTNWGEYLSGTTPIWSKLVLAGHSQGGDMATFTAYKQQVSRAINISGPPQATMVNGVEVGAPYLAGARMTDIRSIYGFVSVNDFRYIEGVYAAVWVVLGFTTANHDGEEKLDLPNASIGINCNSGVPSHNFSSSAPTARGTGHDDTLYPWFEDIYKFMLTQ
jgi:Putative Ig domain